MREEQLARLLAARSVAVVGASSDPAKITGRPIAYMLRQGYAGRIYPVNPSRSEVQGLRCYPSLAAIGEPVDLAIVGTRAEDVEAVVREGADAGVGGFVIFSSGFAELDDAGRARQARLAALARERGVLLVGPNCLGIANSATGLVASFTTAMEDGKFERGAFAFVSQSGALGAYWLDLVLRDGLGFSHWITTGNECDLDAGAALSFLADDPDTKVIGLYLESVSDSASFRRGLQRAAQAGKPVFAIKSGRSGAGAAAAASHTGALAGDDAVFDACFRQYGVARVESITAMTEAARLCVWQGVPRGRNIGILSVSGGAGVMLADAATAAGFAVEPFNAEANAALAKVLPSFVQPANPLDITGNVVQNPVSFGQALEAIGRDPRIGVTVIFIGLMHSIAQSFIEAVLRARTASAAPIVIVWIGARPEVLQQLVAARIPVFADIPQAVAALKVVMASADARGRVPATPPPPAPARGGPAQAKEDLTEYEAKARLLKDLPHARIPAGVLVGRGDNPAARIAALRPPLVAKLQSKALKHKSDRGAVLLRLDAAAAAAACASLQALADREGLQAQGVLVEEMVPFDFELVLGLRRDPIFGPVLVIGRGGIEVELSPDVATRLLPLTVDEIEQAIRGLRYARLLEGYRGGPSADLPAIARAIHSLAERFVADPGLQELEINPLAAGGSDVWVLDALATVG